LSWPLRGLTGGDLLSRGGATMWMPPVEVLQQGDKLLVRADLPGLQKDDVRVEVQSGALTIEGERKQEFEETEEGVYRSERVYGRFSRSIPLPEGADADQAKATFRNGVLEVELPVAAQAEQGRRLEIQST
jgi:HSP20 family protein